MAVGQPAAGAAGLVELLFVRLELAVDEVECLLRGTGLLRQSPQSGPATREGKGRAR
jgi:hypothetical protein